jgi:hypothetical protein
MKRWIVAILLSVLLTCPAVLVSADDTPNPGGPSSNFATHRHSKKNKDQEPTEKKKEKENRDKKVDDAIKKAWEEK